MLNINEVKKEFGDCDWMRAVLNDYTVDAVLWLINRVETLEGQICPICHKPLNYCQFCETINHNEISNKDIEEAVNVMIADEIKTKDVTCVESEG